MFLFLVIVSSLNVFASNTFLLTEDRLLSSKSPVLNMYEIGKMAAKEKLLQFKDSFNPSLDLKMYHKVDNQKSLSLTGYDKVTSPIDKRELSISKSFMFGANLKFKLYQNQITNPFIENSATSGAGVELALDLVNSFRHTATHRYQLQKVNLKFQKSVFKYKTYLFKNKVRQFYWSIVANDLSSRILKRLLKNNKNTVKIIMKKFKASIADQGGLSRIQAQEKSTEAMIISYAYQRQELLKNLTSMLSNNIGTQKIILGNYNIDNTISEIKSCTSLIKKNGLKYENSLLKDQSLYIKTLRQLKQRINNTYGDIDVQLIGTADKIGKARGFSNSMSDLTKDGRDAYAVALSVSIPLSLSNVKKIKTIKDNLNYSSLIDKNLLKMNSFHNQTIKMIDLLNRAIKNQGQHNVLLRKSLSNSKEKYFQARLSIEQLITEENNLLQSDLNIVNTKLNIVLTLLDYFSVFNKVNCTFNKIII